MLQICLFGSLRLATVGEAFVAPLGRSASLLAYLALARGRLPAAGPALAGGGTILLLLDPWLTLSVGFSLSAAATASPSPPESARAARAAAVASSTGDIAR